MQLSWWAYWRETNNNSWMSNWPGLLDLRWTIITHGFHTRHGILNHRWTITHGCHTGPPACCIRDQQLLMGVTMAWLDESDTNNYRYSWMSHWQGLLGWDDWFTHWCHTKLVWWVWDEQLHMGDTLAWLVVSEMNSYSWMLYWQDLLYLRWTVTRGCYTDRTCWVLDKQLLMDVKMARLDESETKNYSWVSHWPDLLDMRWTILLIDVTLAGLLILRPVYSWMSHWPGIGSETSIYSSHSGLAWRWAINAVVLSCKGLLVIKFYLSMLWCNLHYES